MSSRAGARDPGGWEGRPPLHPGRSLTLAMTSLEQFRDLHVIRTRLLAIAGQLRGSCRARESVEAVRRVLQRSLIRVERFLRLVRFEKTVAEHLARRADRAGSHRTLLRRILEIRRRPQRRLCLLVMPLSVRDPALRRANLNIELTSPVA